MEIPQTVGVSRRVLARIARATMALGFLAAAVTFFAGNTAAFLVAMGVLLAGAAAAMVIEATAPNPKDAPGAPLPDLEDRKRWDERPLAEPWAEHELCDECHGKKLCPRCGGEGGCEACAGLCWCSACGGAGQWPRDPHRAIYTPAPARKRSA